MRKKIQDIIYGFARVLELILSVLLIIMIVIFTIKLIIEAFTPEFIMAESDMFNLFIEELMTLAVGVELIKMLCVHTPGTVVEVLLFAIARSIVVSHSSVVDTFVGVMCIIVLFATRKFLFLEQDRVHKDKQQEEVVEDTIE